MFRNTFQNVSRTDHPVRANFGGLRHHLLDGAATPPLQGVSRAVLLASSITERKSAARKQKTYRPTSLRGDFAFPAGCPRRPCPAEDLWVMIRACARGFVLGPLRGWNSIGRNHRNVQIAHICYTKLMRHDFALENGGLLRLHDPVKREHHNG